VRIEAGPTARSGKPVFQVEPDYTMVRADGISPCRWIWLDSMRAIVTVTLF
jgi:hypothetical protein